MMEDEIYGVWVAADGNIQAAIDSLVGLGRHGVVNLQPGSTFVLAAGLVVDLSLISLRGNGCLLDASGIPNGTAAITLTGSVNPPYENAAQRVVDLRISGGGRGTSNTRLGVLFNTNTAATNGSSHAGIERVVVHGFHAGFTFRNRSYINQLLNAEAFDCDIGLVTEVAVDGGENISMVGGALYNNGLAIKAQGINADLFLTGTSIDYNTKIAEISGGTVQLTSCHVEAGDYAAIPITLSGNGVGMFVRGGRWLLSGSPPRSFSHWVEHLEASTSFQMHGTALNNTRSATGNWATGPGFTFLDKWHSFGFPNNCPILSETENRLADGGFERSVIVDDIYLSEDTAPITSKLTGTNIQIAQSGDQHRSGSKSLKVTKTYGAGSLGSFILMQVPVQPGDIPGCRFWVTRPGTSSGSILYFFAWLKMRSGGAVETTPAPFRSDIFAAANLDLGTTSLDWTPIEAHGNLVRAPAWATHYQVGIQMFNWDARGDSLYFDDCIVTKAG